MTKRIKHVSELPAWFKLEKYAFTKALNTVGWYEQLIIRYFCLTDLMKINQEKTPLPEKTRGMIDAICENPHLAIMNKEKFLTAYNQSIKILSQQNTNNIRGVRSTTMKDYLFIRQNLNDEKLVPIKKWLNSTDEERKYQPDYWLNKPLYTFFEDERKDIKDFIYIDLSYTDKELIGNFKKYLGERRKYNKSQYYAGIHYTKADFNSWSKLAIIPLLDLQIFCLEYQIKMPNRILADALYPSGEKGEETVRKTAQPLALELMEAENLLKLAFQVTIEKTEKFF